MDFDHVAFIKFKDKKISSIEMEKEQDVKKKVVDILSEGDFQKISIQKHNGKVVNIRNTIKMKF